MANNGNTLALHYHNRIKKGEYHITNAIGLCYKASVLTITADTC